MVKKHYTVEELVERLESIAGLEVLKVEDLVEEERPGVYIGIINFTFDKPDEKAVEQARKVLRDAEHWDDEILDHPTDTHTAFLIIETDAPSAVLEKFNLM